MDNEDMRLYEVGFLLVPTLPEDKVASTVADIRGIVEKAGGSIKTEEFPKFRRLAYEMRKKIDTKYETYDSAYFGYIVFEGTVDSPLAIKEGMDAEQAVLRYIVVKDPVLDRLTEQEAEELPVEIAAEAAGDEEVAEVVDGAEVEDEASEDDAETKE